jgi:hypothetical protein
MNSNLRKYAFDLAEDYLIFIAQFGFEESEMMSAETYIRARIKNVQDELFRYAVEQTIEMGVGA